MNISYYFRFCPPAITLGRAAFLLTLVLGLAGGSGNSFAKSPGKLSPAKVKQIKQSNKSYKECQKTALQDHKSKKLAPPALKSALDRCKERYPGASLYVSCKKKALRAAKAARSPDRSGNDVSDDIAACKQYLTAAAFDPDASVPFFHDAGQLYFAGIGLNKPTSLRTLSPPNFECSRLRAATEDPTAASYFLFGNHPSVLGAWQKASVAELNRLLRLTPKAAQKEARSKNGYLVPGVGRIFGALQDKSAAVFFPSAPCDFEGQTGVIYAGLSAHYLIEPENQVAPYFAIAYYKGSQRIVTTTDLIAQTMARLGSDFRPFKKNSQVTFITSSPITETDSERDPHNLCRSPRPHQMLGVIQSLKDNPRQPEYLIVANVKNLCDYGDRLARRLAK